MFRPSRAILLGYFGLLIGFVDKNKHIEYHKPYDYGMVKVRQLKYMIRSGKHNPF